MSENMKIWGSLNVFCSNCKRTFKPDEKVLMKITEIYPSVIGFNLVHLECPKE